MKRILFSIAIFLQCTLLFAQEPRLHPTQHGLFGAGANSFFMSDVANSGGQWATQATAQSTLNYWTLSGSDVYRSAGKVGINTATINSDYNLHVAGAGLFESSAYKALRAGHSTGGWIEAGLLGQSKTGLQYLTNAGGFGDFLLQPNGGNVAIGQASAAAKLDVNGAIRAFSSTAYTGTLPTTSALQLGGSDFGITRFNNGNTYEMVFLTYGKVPFSVDGYGGVSNMLIRDQTNAGQHLRVVTKDNTVTTNSSFWYQMRNNEGQILSWNQPGGLNIGTTSTAYPVRLYASGGTQVGLSVSGSYVGVGKDYNTSYNLDVAGTAKISSTLFLGTSTVGIITNGTSSLNIWSKGTVTIPTSYSTTPSGLGNGDLWMDFTVSGKQKYKARLNDINTTLANIEEHFVGGSTSVLTGTTYELDASRNANYRANANNITVNADLDMEEGIEYLAFCQQNSSNTITFSPANMGGTCYYSGCTTLGGCSTFVAASNGVYGLVRKGITLWVKAY